MKNDITFVSTIAISKEMINTRLVALMEFNTNNPFLPDAKKDITDWLNAVVSTDATVDKRQLSNFRFLKKELADLIEACSHLAEELHEDYGATTSQKLWNRFTEANRQWDALPHSLSEAELNRPVSVLKEFFQQRNPREWRKILEDFDDATIAFNNDFFEGFEHNNAIFAIRDQLHKLMDAAYLILAASVTNDNTP